METLLQNKNAVIYGAGSAVARAFVREGAKLLLLLIGLGAAGANAQEGPPAERVHDASRR